MVQACLGYSVRIKKDLVELETVQMRATQMIRGPKRIPFKERPQYLGLLSWADLAFVLWE